MARSGMAWRREGFRWRVRPPWSEAAALASRLKTSPLVAQVLHNRGLEDPEAVKRFLSPRLTDLHPPELLSGMDAAAERLARAVRDRQRICIYGDYDVDGVAGVAILYRCLTMHAGDVDYYVPHRLSEGYGVHAPAVERIAAEGTRLLVTVDCGASAVEPLALAGRLGMDVIVTDHHTPGPVLPSALAIVHPALAREGSGPYPNPDLSGAGVAFKLAWQVARALGGGDRVDGATRDFLMEATALAALGIIADVVPLRGENRVLAAYGLKSLAVTEHPGLRALVESARLSGQRLQADHVGFFLAPRLNACGRMGHARSAVELLARADAERSRRIAASLERMNARRQQVEREILQQAVEMVESGRQGGPDERAIVLASANWHAGVVGIVAARLVERYARPAVVIALDGQEGQGSGRSIQGFPMDQALAACAEHLVSFGGHAMAGGLRLPAGKIEAFARALKDYARRRIAEEDLRPALDIDAQTTLGELSLPVVQHLERLAPFGQGNPRPLVAVRSGRVLACPQRLGRGGETISFLIAQENARIRCVGFGMAALVDRLGAVRTVDVAAQPVVNRFNGRESVELHLRDVRWT